MFKNISSILENKHKKIVKSSDLSSSVRQAVKLFYETHIGNGIKPEVEYNYQEKELIIQTKNKIIASEIAIRLADLSDLLKKENIPVKRILVR